MFIYILSLPIWNLVLPVYAYWKFDDFSWGDTRKTAGEKTKKAGIEYEGEFDSSKITMKRWKDFESGKTAPRCVSSLATGKLTRSRTKTAIASDGLVTACGFGAHLASAALHL